MKAKIIGNIRELTKNTKVTLYFDTGRGLTRRRKDGVFLERAKTGALKVLLGNNKYPTIVEPDENSQNRLFIKT